MKKRWVKIKGTDDFWINEDGFVMNNKTGRIIGAKDRNGYYCVGIKYNDERGWKYKQNHVLCFEHFGYPPEDYWNNRGQYHIHHLNRDNQANGIWNLACWPKDFHLSEANLGKKLSEETKLKISLGSKGKKHSKQTRKKMSETKSLSKNPQAKLNSDKEYRNIQDLITYSRLTDMSLEKVYKLASKIYGLKPSSVFGIWDRYYYRNQEKRKEIDNFINEMKQFLGEDNPKQQELF